MFSFLDNISSKKRSLIIIAIILIIAITFETFQQAYYINRYNLASDISFFGILKTQSYRWTIWLILSFVLVRFTKRNINKKQLTSYSIFIYGLVIIGLVAINIIIISISQMLFSESVFSIKELLSEYIPFFTYQKAPIYTLGYIAITIILYLYFTKEQLQIEVQELAQLKQTNSHLYKKLSSSIDDKATILNIKIGNKRKIIAVDDINWIEADDYCVKVHTTNEASYVMRSSLKALEEKLNGNFLRVHRKAIVNMDMTKELNLSNSPYLILKNDTEILISKSNLKTVKNFLA